MFLFPLGLKKRLLKNYIHFSIPQNIQVFEKELLPIKYQFCDHRTLVREEKHTGSSN